MVRCRDVKINREECLHDIVHANNLEKLKHYLKQGVELECRNCQGYTPFYLSLHRCRSDEFILTLLNAGCNINTLEDITPLHIAVSRCSAKVAYELLKRGADINAQNMYKETPLQIAIRNGNLEGVCLLLQHGADVNIMDCGNTSPLMNSLKYGEEEISEALFGYYDDFSCIDSDQNNALHYSISRKSRFTADIIKAGADVNIMSRNGKYPLTYSLSYDDCKMFKLIWNQVDYHILLKNRYPFLLTYLNKCCFPVEEWLECLYILLTSPVAVELVEEFETYHTCGMSFIGDLLFAFIAKTFDTQDRLRIIYLFLSLGNTIRLRDVRLIVSLYGFKEELEAFIFAGNFQNEGYTIIQLLPLPTFIMAIEEDVTSEFLYQIFSNQIRQSLGVEDVVMALSFFSLPQSMKNKLSKLSKKHSDNEDHQIIQNKLQKIPGVPSLLEVSRNKARIYIKTAYRVTKPYQFHDAVNNLILPKKLKDILRFKVPLYRD